MEGRDFPVAFLPGQSAQFPQLCNALGLHSVETYHLAFQPLDACSFRLTCSLQALLLLLRLSLCLASTLARRRQLFCDLQSLARLQHLDLAVYLVVLCLERLCAFFCSLALIVCRVQISPQPRHPALHAILCQLRAAVFTGSQLRSTQSKILLCLMEAFAGAISLLDTFFFCLDSIDTFNRAYYMGSCFARNFAQ